jgi:hypothetical protein
MRALCEDTRALTEPLTQAIGSQRFEPRAGERVKWSKRAMSRTMLRPLLRRAPGRKSQAPRATRPVERTARQALIDRRDRCMAEISRFWSEPGNSGSLFEKARQLLTRRWSASSWRGRADILRTAEWLIGIAKKGAGSAKSWEETADGRTQQTGGNNIAEFFG